MKATAAAYGSALAAMLVLDGSWLGLVAKDFYAQHLGYLMADSPKLGAAAIFYVLYIAGITALVVLPALRRRATLSSVALSGALFGLVAYATYDLTNQATIKDWPVTVTIVDLAWGTFITACTSVVSLLVARRAAA